LESVYFKTGRTRVFKAEWLLRPLPAPHPQLGLVVVIPSHAEPDLLSTLQSLQAASQPDCAVEVIWVLNASAEAASAIHTQHLQDLEQILAWQKAHSPWFELILLNAADLPPKHAGVGLARRIGMDLATERLLSLGRGTAPIVCLDADCTVAENYFVALERHFYSAAPKSPACSIAFAHPLKEGLSEDLAAGILRYELYLRYYVQGLRYAQLPCAFHTIGSSMAVRAGVYRAQGGMNRRKAGEDFYFLHKLMPLGGFTQINSTCVYPTARVSERVPFGTGKAMGEWLSAPNPAYPVYHPQSFAQIQQLLQGLQGIYPLTETKLSQFESQLPVPLKRWFAQEAGPAKLVEIQANSSSEKVFFQRFFRWLDGFAVLKLVHFLRAQSDMPLPEIPLAEAALTLALWRSAQMGQSLGLPAKPDLAALLAHYRQLDRLPYRQS
jgi:hypothetical protein